jgi:lincosamide nucleotidyltransferase A/C/D/E
MLFDQVVEMLDALDAAGIRSWVAGGWGIAALVGRQTRAHRDLDLVIDGEQLERCLDVLAGLGYDVETDWLPTRVELRGPGHAWVDVHPLRFDEDGRARLELPDGTAVDYPPGALTTGELHGRDFGCLSARQQRAVHTGYEPRAEDRHDLAQLDHRHPSAGTSGPGRQRTMYAGSEAGAARGGHRTGRGLPRTGRTGPGAVA